MASGDPILVAKPVDGLLDITGASGGQVKFPAAQNASADANTLDDYEEGTWAPTLTSFTLGGDATVTVTGTYTKIGRLVFITILIDCTGTTTIASVEDTSHIDNLPFNAAVGATIGFNRGTSSTSLGVGIIAGGSIWTPGWAASPAGANIVASGCYHV